MPMLTQGKQTETKTKTGMAMLISDNVSFKAKHASRNREYFTKDVAFTN